MLVARSSPANHINAYHAYPSETLHVWHCLDNAWILEWSVRITYCLLCRRIPGFPKIDTNNDYFLARFDGALIDGQSWTRVGPYAGSMQSISPPDTAVHRALLAQLQQLEVRVVGRA